MKILGYFLDSDGECTAHVDNMVAKMKKKIWAIQRLKQYGFDKEQLISVYTTYIRPIAEYVSVVWHASLNADQAALLERQQARALSHIFGFGLSARKMLEKSGLESLASRRDRACLVFATKCTRSDREWFPKRPPPIYARRALNYNEFQERRARTDRHRNSGLNAMRRILNRN